MFASGEKSAVAFKSRCRMYRAAAQSINASSTTKLEFDTVLYDNNSECDIVTNHRWTCKEAGWYSVKGQVGLNNVTVNRTVIPYLCKNGDVIEYPHNSTPATADLYTNFAVDIQLEVDDYLEVKVWHNSDGAEAVEVGNDRNFLSIHRFA